MELNDKNQVASAIQDIICRVVKDKNSPYKTMMRKAKDIDIDYFEQISRGNNRLSEKLNLNLKEQVMEAFGKMADSYYVTSGLQKQLKSFVLEEARNAKEQKYFLLTLAQELELAAEKEIPSPGWPRYTNADLQEKYRNAKEITLKEFFMGSNGKDILEFYNALMDNTWWACKELIAERTKLFLRGLSKEIHEMAERIVESDTDVNKEERADDIKLPKELLELAEQMAERVHDVWAEERIRQGWSYGEQRDDVQKKHPCLIPYKELPVEEKIYDRNTSMETLRFILKQGFKITK